MTMIAGTSKMRSSNVTVSILFFLVLGRATSALTLHSSSSSSFVRAASLFQAQCSSNDATTGHCTLYMRKQKASDKRTRRLQREGGGVNALSSSSITQSPMEQVGLWKVKDLTKQMSTAQPRSTAATTTMTPTAVQTQSATGGRGGRGRSRKRSTLYNSISFYHDKFLHLLTAEYQAEENEVTGRMQAAKNDDPLALEVAGFALYDMQATRRGNLFRDEVYRLEKAPDASTIYADNNNRDSNHQRQRPRSDRYRSSPLPPNHKFARNDVLLLTLQPKGSGDFFSESSFPLSEVAVKAEARVLNTGPTYIDIAMMSGSFQVAFGMDSISTDQYEPSSSLSPKVTTNTKDNKLRFRADRFFSDVPYQRMVSALSQLTQVPTKTAAGGSSRIDGHKKVETKSPNGKSNSSKNDRASTKTSSLSSSALDEASHQVPMDPVLRQVILSTMTFTDPSSPLLHDDDVGQYLENQAYPMTAKPPMSTSIKLAQQVIRYMVQQQQPENRQLSTFAPLNDPQLAAVEAALTRRLTMIQGPPGSGKTTVAGAIGFGFVHQCRSIFPPNGDDENQTTNAKVLACAFSNVGADNLAEAFERLGLKVLRVARASAVSENLWNSTMDAAIDRDPQAQLALQNAAKVTAQLANLRQGGQRNHGRGGTTSGSGGERMMRQAATTAVEASIQACNVAATRALRQADVIVSTCTGAADPRLLAACGIYASDADDLTKLKNDWNGDAGGTSTGAGSNTLIRGNAPDGLTALSLPFVIVDEACQSVEPGVLIPLVSSNSCRSLVMLGDPCQLPPTVRSSSSSPLSISLMERLAALLPQPAVRLSAPHQNSEQNDAIEYLDSLPIKQARSLLHTMDRERKATYRKRYSGSILLSVQYRMHPSIAAFPSAIFYDGLLSTPAWMADARAFPIALRRLMPCADPRLCVRMVDVGGRGNERRGNPSLDSGSSLVGVDEQTSYWNEPEAQRVVDLVKELLVASDPGIQSIGVISPYNAQVYSIRSMLEADAEIQALLQRKNTPCPTIEVKSVDGYQGRERDIILFSAVRSNRHGAIGFLRDWRRMNVALTRAKHGLIILGDLETLAEKDKHWASLLRWGRGVRCIVDDSYHDDDDEEASP